ncbi:MAG: ABC transporter ATP-binding protein [Bdellovibrionales bacterium]
MIEVKNLKKNFQTRQGSLEILKGLNFSIQPGEIVAFTGHSGSGKSTLLGLLAGLDTPTSGDILYKGQSLGTLSPVELQNFRARNLSLIFQNYYLIPHLTALENVQLPLQILGLHDQIPDAKRLLQEVGLQDRLHHFPSELSGGESQRVAIARGLAVKPMVLFADEPTGSLDSETGSKVMTLYFDLVRKFKLTSIIVTHNQELAELCDRQFRLAQGVIAT